MQFLQERKKMTGGLLIKAILIGGLLITMVTGINIPLIILDLILKTLNIISGNTFFKSIFSQAFEPSNPIFIIYVSIFLISFVLSLLFIIKASLQSTMNHSEFREKTRNKSMLHK
jgi:ABC-type multidrug transport system permease subunit